MRSLITAIIIALSSTCAFAQQEDEIGELLNSIGEAQNKVGQMNSNIHAPEPCEEKDAGKVRVPASSVVTSTPANDEPRTITIEGAGADKELNLSLLTPEQAMKAHGIAMDMKTYLRYDVAAEGCVPRAQIIAMRLEEAGMIGGKAWVQVSRWDSWTGGKLNPLMPGSAKRYDGWSADFHVAPFVMVNNKGKVEKWVIDPLLDPKKPLEFSEWQRRISDDPESRTVSLTSRFVYGAQQVGYEHPDYYNPTESSAKDHLAEGLRRYRKMRSR